MWSQRTYRCVLYQVNHHSLLLPTSPSSISSPGYHNNLLAASAPPTRQLTHLKNLTRELWVLVMSREPSLFRQSP